MNGDECEEVFQSLSLASHIERAVGYTIEYLRGLAQLNPDSKLLDGRIFHCGAYHFFRGTDLIVQVESPYEVLQPGIGCLDIPTEEEVREIVYEKMKVGG